MNNLQAIYVGIDVACAKGKRLPVCFSMSVDDQLAPMPISPEMWQRVPRGLGNAEVLAEIPFRETARRVVDALDSISEDMGWRIGRIAIDAPAAAPTNHQRHSEKQLADSGQSSFQTPLSEAWEKIHKQCSDHLKSGQALARLPNANRIWMLFGFELFREIRSRSSVEVIEVCP